MANGTSVGNANRKTKKRETNNANPDDNEFLAKKWKIYTSKTTTCARLSYCDVQTYIYISTKVREDILAR